MTEDQRQTQRDQAMANLRVQADFALLAIASFHTNPETQTQPDPGGASSPTMLQWAQELVTLSAAMDALNMKKV